MNAVKRTVYHFFGNYAHFLSSQELDENSTVGGYISNYNKDWKKGETVSFVITVKLPDNLQGMFVWIQQPRYKGVN